MASQWNERHVGESVCVCVCVCVNMCNCVQDSRWTITVTATCRQAHSEPDNVRPQPARSLPLLSLLSTFFPYRYLSEQLLESPPVIYFLFIYLLFFFLDIVLV